MKLKLSSNTTVQIIPGVETLHRYGETSFPSGLFCSSTADKHCSMPCCRHPGNVYLVILKVSMTYTYTDKNEKQPRGFAKRILKD